MFITNYLSYFFNNLKNYNLNLIFIVDKINKTIKLKIM